MVELIATLVITTGSAALFAYWFRYTCLLILNTKTARDFASEVAAANQLNFVHVQSALQGSAGDLEALKTALDRDYKVLNTLLKSGDVAIEDRMLAINYKLTSAWFSACNRFSPSAARRAVDELSMVVAHFANSIGERAMAPQAI